MVRRKIERAEVVPLCFGLGTEGDGEAQLTEDFLDLFDDDRDGMLSPAPDASSRQREVFGDGAIVPPAEGVSSRVERTLQRLPDGVESFAGLGLIHRRQIAQ